MQVRIQYTCSKHQKAVFFIIFVRNWMRSIAKHVFDQDVRTLPVQERRVYSNVHAKMKAKLEIITLNQLLYGSLSNAYAVDVHSYRV